MTLFTDLTGPDIGRRADDILFLPLGSVEQHGPHLPVDTDACLARAFAKAGAERTNGIVGPDFAYGYRSQPVSGGGELFPGTISLSGATYSALVRDLVVAYARHGHRRIVFVNGHFENTMFAIEGINLALEQKAETDVLVVNWWEIIEAKALDELFEGRFPGWEAEHAGVVETSLMLHVDPSRVDTALISPHVATVTAPPYTRLPEPPGQVDPSGVLRTAAGSSAEIGRGLFGLVDKRLGDLVAAEFGA
ncbi:creatininase [Amycolatopsis jejuensis]|uniref:creatininase n=1 Tax=Amycolatopsis jejuensis TaxID=330084 RepID=UPI000524A9B6|nr:creatininase [Amycolatopsis jejuensis]